MTGDRARRPVRPHAEHLPERRLVRRAETRKATTLFSFY